MIGKKFGKLTVLSQAPPGKFLGTYWVCICDCGNNSIVRRGALVSGGVKSCGCLRKDFSDMPVRRQTFSNYKSWAKKKKREFKLSFEEFDNMTKEPCFYCGKHDEIVRTKRNSSYAGNGVDRHDNMKGYTIENCVPCCRVHNHMKSDMTSEEFISACRSVVNHLDAKQNI